ncbi:MAG: type III-B CRISPR module RAMP protein Cmr1 [Chloroflexales bacterium]
MSRTLPVDNQGKPKAPPTLAIDPAAPTVHVRSYHVITPLFGGGVEPQQADPVTTVRSSEVRGHLRFWWRATRAGRYGANGLQQMKEAEDWLWGSTERQSLVEVEVRNVQTGTLITHLTSDPTSPFLGDPIKSPISYAAFPLRRMPERPNPGGLRFGVSFDLAVTLPTDPELRRDVLAALWAWETFGGVGARTRRGFGALHCHAVSGTTGLGPWLPTSRDSVIVLGWLRDRLSDFVVPGSAPIGVPLLPLHASPQGPFKVGTRTQLINFAQNPPLAYASRLEKLLKDNRLAPSNVDDLLPALVVWYYPIHKLREFRQSRRDKNGKPYGRSYWPEPDEIRRRTTGFLGKHAVLSHTRKFPRAVFGLPIVFQFMHVPPDPPPTMLQGAHHDRMASRLILRPLACADDKFVSLALVLDAPPLPPGGLTLAGAAPGLPITTTSLTAAEAAFPPLTGKTDVLQAFLDTL